MAQRTPRREEPVIKEAPLRSEDEQDMDNSHESSEEHRETSENFSEVLSDDTVHDVDEEASIAEVSDDIELFTSELDSDSLHHQRKRGAASESHVKKKSRKEGKPP